MVKPKVELKEQISPHLYGQDQDLNEKKTFPISEESEKMKMQCMRRKMRAVVRKISLRGTIKKMNG